MTALKIAFFTSFSFPQGTYFRWHNLAIGLQKFGHQVTVHAIGPARLGRTQREVRDGVRYVLVPATPLLERLLDFRLDPVTLLRAMRHSPEPSDIYHVFQPFPHSCLPGLFHRSNSRCMVYDWDDLWWGGLLPERNAWLRPSDWLPRSVQFLERNMPRKVDCVTTCSSYLADCAIENGAERVEVIHNGYWPVQSQISKSAAREEVGLNAGAFYFGFMGRTLGEIDWCLDALAAIPPPGREVRLALCGMAPSTIQSLPDRLRASIDYLGNLTPEQTRTFARALDCGLLPLENTPFNQSRFPIKFAEYLAAGAHVIASDVGECAQFANELPGVTLCGTSRDSWKARLGSTNWQAKCSPFATDSGSALAQTIGWQAITQQLQSLYFSLITP